MDDLIGYEVKVDRELLEKFLKNELKELCEGLSTKEVHKVTGYSLTSIVKWINSNKLKAVKVKNRFIIPKDELIYFLCDYGYYNKIVNLKIKIFDLHTLLYEQQH